MHLFVVCTVPCHAGKVVLANITTWKDARCDDTVRITSGAHPFITHDSYVAYNFSEIERAITVEAGIRLGRFIPREKFQEPDLTRISDGLLLSQFTPRKVKKYLGP